MIGSESAAVAQDPSAASHRYDLARALAILAIVVVTATVVALPLIPHVHVGELLTLRLAVRQDLPLVPLFLGAALLWPVLSQNHHGRPPINIRAGLAIAVLILLVAGPIGHAFVFHNYNLSRDEQMAVFDQEIFAHGRLFWPIPVEWRPIANALNRRFMLPIGANEYWVSSYLPMHSAFRALLSLVGLADFASAIMTAVAAVALWSIARRLWPQSSHTVILSLVLLVTSSQVLITSMTAYSMSMHLALNLVWLLLFLKDTRRSHLLAVLIAFIATGIHQPLFHPLFAMPFVALLAFQGRWRLFLFYFVAYSLIGVFWSAWPWWITAHGVGPVLPISCGHIANCASPPSFFGRLLGAFTTFDAEHLWLTSANLVRFVCWQHPLLLPLAVFGGISCWRAEPLVKALSISFLLPIIVMAIILPWQGHGWGYRYLHPVLGNAILLACFGFHRLEISGLSMRRPLALTTVAAILFIPVHAAMASRVTAPFVQLHNDLAATRAGVVIVDTDHVPYGQDTVINRYNLSNRPILLIASLLTPQDLPAICKRSSVAFFDGPRLAPLARWIQAPIQSASPETIRLHETAKAIGCNVVNLPTVTAGPRKSADAAAGM